MNKKVILIIAFISIIFINTKITSASEYDKLIIEKTKNFIQDANFDVKKDINLNENDLSINKIQYLPTQLKCNIGDMISKINIFLTRNDLAEIDLYIKDSLKKTKELELCNKADDKKCIDKAINNYKKTKEILYKRIDKVDNEHKKYILENLITSEINQNILLENILTNYSYKNSEINLIRNDNIDKLGRAIINLDYDELYIKQALSFAIDKQNENKSILNKILINDFLNQFKLRTNIKIKLIIDGTIEQNYVDVVKNINRLNIEKDNINIEKNIKYYLYKTYNDNVIEQVQLIDKLYSIQNNIENSKIKDIVSIAIINSRQIPISLLNISLEKLNTTNLDTEIDKIIGGDILDKINIVMLLEKYGNTNGILIYKLQELEETYKNNIISNLANLDNTEKEIKLKEYINKLSYENLNFITSILKILDQDAVNNSNPEFKLVYGRISDLITKKGLVTGQICSNYYEPVCGVDNITYDNECFIEKVGIDIKYKAECRIEENTKLKPITEKDLNRGWYYGTKETKKPDTPLNWILVDEKTKYSKWTDPKLTIILK